LTVNQRPAEHQIEGQQAIGRERQLDIVRTGGCPIGMGVSELLRDQLAAAVVLPRAVFIQIGHDESEHGAIERAQAVEQFPADHVQNFLRHAVSGRGLHLQPMPQTPVVSILPVCALGPQHAGPQPAQAPGQTVKRRPADQRQLDRVDPVGRRIDRAEKAFDAAQQRGRIVQQRQQRQRQIEIQAEVRQDVAEPGLKLQVLVDGKLGLRVQYVVADPVAVAVLLRPAHRQGPDREVQRQVQHGAAIRFGLESAAQFIDVQNAVAVPIGPGSTQVGEQAQLHRGGTIPGQQSQGRPSHVETQREIQILRCARDFDLDAAFRVNVEHRRRDIAQIKAESQMQGRRCVQSKLRADLQIYQVVKIESQPIIQSQIGDIQIESVHERVVNAISVGIRVGQRKVLPIQREMKCRIGVLQSHQLLVVSQMEHVP